MRGWGGAGGQGWFVDVIMILNIKTCFNKKSNTFSFGASVIVKQSSSLLNIFKFKMKSLLKHF